MRTGTEMQAPLIQLCFYWHNRPETASFQRVLDFLLGVGYRIGDGISAVRAVRGRIPPIPHYQMEGEPVELRSFEALSSDKLTLPNGYFPIEIAMSSPNKRLLNCVLGFSRVRSYFPMTDEPYVIEIVASAAEWDRVENVPQQSVSNMDSQRARIQKAWFENKFERACEKLLPDVAGRYVENELRPPSEMVKSENPLDFSDIFVSKQLCGSGEFASRIEACRGWSVRRRLAGLYIRATFPSARQSWGGAKALVRQPFRDLLNR